MIILPIEDLRRAFKQRGTDDVTSYRFKDIDNGDVYLAQSIGNRSVVNSKVVDGYILWTKQGVDQYRKSHKHSYQVFVDAVPFLPLLQGEKNAENWDETVLTGFVSCGSRLLDHTVQIVSIRDEIFSRLHGLYETDVLRGKTVLIVGLGSGGAAIAVELAKAGIDHFILIDHDRLEAGNVVRHICGLSDLGRYKTKAVREHILDTNPGAQVRTFEEKIRWAWNLEFKRLVSESDLVFCATDNRPSRSLINKVCIDVNKICIYAGTFRRAYGGQVLRVIPNQTMCYQCFIDTLVEDPLDQEISSEEQASNIAYSDRPVPIEPGLSADIAPISNMSVKLGILELLRGTKTSLSSLYEDLSGTLFQWLNRREVDTKFEQLPPMESSEATLRIMSWYSVKGEKNPSCPVCGNFLLEQNCIPTKQDIEKFSHAG